MTNNDNNNISLSKIFKLLKNNLKNLKTILKIKLKTKKQIVF